MRYPDLEIYAKDITFKDVDDWLKATFKAVERKDTVKKKSEARSYWTVDGSDVIVFGNALGHYSSIWFKQNNTPWDTDLECARDAAKTLNTQIRCSNSGWEEGQSADTQWWRVTKEEGEMLIQWDV